jgi:ribose transport system permease protein
MKISTMNSPTQARSASKLGLLDKLRVGNRAVLEAVQGLGLFAVIVIVSVLLGLASPVFFSRINIENLFYSATIIAVVAIGEAFVILVGGIDLSVGAVLALSSVLCVGLPLFADVPIWLSTLVALGTGAGIGLINGLSVTVLKIPALIATLAMMSIARGVAFIYSGGRSIAPVPSIYVDIQATRFFGIPVVILFTIALGILAHFVLSSTRFGRAVYATGGNALAARLSGIRTNQIVLAAYVISGIAAAIGGLMITARLEAGAATAGFGTELTVISAVVIGGVSLLGGEGKIGGVLLGVLLLGLVQNAINLLNVPPNYDYVVSGLVIAAAAGLDVFRRSFAEAGLRRRSILRKDEAKSQRGSAPSATTATPPKRIT